MPETQQWFQWRVKPIVNVEAGANMAGARLNLVRCAISIRPNSSPGGNLIVTAALQ
jgi:hypothetical protein